MNTGGGHHNDLDETLLGIVDFPSVRRGYAPASVQAFVSAAHAELRRLGAETRTVQNHVSDLESQLESERHREHPASLVAPVDPLISVAPRISPLDEWAQRTAEMLAGARIDMDNLMTAARAEAAEMLARAQDDAHQIRQAAEDEATQRLLRSDDQRMKMVSSALEEQQRAAVAADQARAELARVERQRESITTSLQSLQSALQQAVETITLQGTPSGSLPVTPPPPTLPGLDDTPEPTWLDPWGTHAGATGNATGSGTGNAIVSGVSGSVSRIDDRREAVLRLDRDAG